jgi:O-antigen/teichoic acid export membrane protein
MKFSIYSKNMFAVLGGDVASKVLGFLVAAYLARTLGDSGFGMIHIAMAGLSYAMLISTNGLSLYGTRETARSHSKNRAFISHIVSLRLVLSLIAMGGLVVYAQIFQENELVRRLTVIFSLFLIPNALLLDWYFQGLHRMEVVAAGRVAQMTCYLLLILLTVEQVDDVLWVGRAWVIGGTLNALLLGWYFMRSRRTIPFTIDYRKWLHILRLAMPLGLATILSQLIVQLPFFYLDHQNLTNIAGQYGVAFRLMMALLVFDRIFYTVFYPAISKISGHPTEKFSEIVNRILKLVTVSAILLTLFAIVLAPTAINLIFGTTYSSAVMYFRLLCFFFLGSFVNSVVGFTLAGRGKIRQYYQAYAIAFIVSLVLAVLLTGWIGFIGMILALSIYQMIALLVGSVFLSRDISIRWFRSLILPLTAGVLMIVFLITAVETDIWNFLYILLFFIALLVISNVTKADFVFLKRILF